MDFPAIQFFLFLYFIRPQDWIPGIEGARLVTLNMGWAILATLSRPQGFSLSTLFKTPTDWMMFAYFFWVVGTAPDRMETFGEAKGLFVFYIVTLLALSSWERMTRFLTWWTILLLIVAGLAVGSLYGFDVTGAAGPTASQKGRLSLNTWMLNNPNALGHTVIAALPLTYFLFCWRRSSTSRMVAPLWFALAGACVYYTESKGAYVVGAITLAMSQIFGRPRLAQIIMLCIAATAGVALVTQLPRMQTLSSADAGIQGRLMAWKCARDAMNDNTTGVGWKKFTARFKWQKQWMELATHGSYVQIGAALGYGGLFLYIGVLYCGFRALTQTKTKTDEQERVRRILFTLLISYTVSNWMIDRAYHTEFFVIAAAVAAFHRLSLQRTDESGAAVEDEADGDEQPTGLPGHLWPVPALATGALQGDSGRFHALATSATSVIPEREGIDAAAVATSEVKKGVAMISWRRLGLVDLAIVFLAFRGVLAAWDYILKHM